MWNACLSMLVALVTTLGTVTTVLASPSLSTECNVCTCDSGDIICLDAFSETVEEQMICGDACATIGSTHGSREFFDQPCDTLSQCGNVAAPVANGPWFAASALGLLALGALALRRMKSRTAA